jgi:hypothetical protein
MVYVRKDDPLVYSQLQLFQEVLETRMRKHWDMIRHMHAEV